MKNIDKSTLAAAILAAGVLSTAERLHATGFTQGDLVVDQVGSGSATLSNAATAVILDEFNPGTGLLVQSISLDTTGNSVTQSGTATSEGFIHFSADDSSVVVSGYNVAAGTTATNPNGSALSIASSNTTLAPRAVAVFSVATGTQGSLTTLGTAYNGNNIRAAASPDGSTLFTTGATTGQYTATAGSNTSASAAPTLISATKVNSRDIGIYDGGLFFTSGSNVSGVYQVGALGSNYSTAASQTANLVINTNQTGGGGTSPYGFSIGPNGLTAYVADSSGTITKYTRGSTTVAFTTVAAQFKNSADAFTGLTVDYGSNTVYVADPTNVFSLADQGASFGTLNTVETAAANTAFRGLDFDPVVVPEPKTWLAGILTTFLFVWSQRRRLTAGLAAWIR